MRSYISESKKSLQSVKAGNLPESIAKSISSPLSSHEKLPLFKTPELRQSLDKLLDLVTDYTFKTKKDVDILREQIRVQVEDPFARTRLAIKRSQARSVEVDQRSTLDLIQDSV
jgi:hypothetical protein